jgi:hypothetical protein
MKVGDIWKKSVEHFPIHRLRCDDLLPVYEKFKQTGYTESNVLKQLDLPDFGRTTFSEFPRYLSVNLKNNTHLDRMIKLFILGLSITLAEAEETFGKAALAIMFDVNLLEKSDTGEISSPVDLYPCRGYFLATDHFHVDYCVPKHVYALMGDSYHLARSIITDPVESSLDLCTGSGVQAIVASGFSKRVVGVDVNPRALNFARFNALLNQVTNVEFRKGNLYEAVKGEKFDRILSNPPFVPSPEKRVFFRDGGNTGEEILEKIVAGLNDHLNDNGMCQIVTLLVFMDEDYNSKVASWVTEKSFNIFSIHEPYFEIENYIFCHFEKVPLTLEQYGEKFNSWLTSYKEANIRDVAHGLINMKHTSAPPQYERKIVKRIVHKGCEDEIKSWFDIMEDVQTGKLACKMRKAVFSLSPYVIKLFEKHHANGQIDYGAIFKAESPYFHSLVSPDEKDLLEILSGMHLTFKELMNICMEKHYTDEKACEENIQNILTSLLKNGIIVMRRQNDEN